jgi:4-amino-4-deoxy-L-arabinose transferase-like glycosyltransferase
MMARHDDLIDFFLHREVVGRIVGHEDGRTGFPGFHFAVAMGFWLPWWPLLILHAKKQWNTWLSGGWRKRFADLPWEPVAAVFVLVIFSFVSSKLITYTIPGLPLLSVGIGALLSGTRFSFRNRYGWFSVSHVTTMASILIGLNLVQGSLGRNSSTRQAVEVLREKGAEWIICDRFLPGLEFYAGEGVWYVDTKDIVQTGGLRGQDPEAHFASADEIHKRLQGIDHSVWLLQSLKKSPAWEQQLIDERPHPEVSALVVGDFKLWQIK